MALAWGQTRRLHSCTDLINRRDPWLRHGYGLFTHLSAYITQRSRRGLGNTPPSEPQIWFITDCIIFTNPNVKLKELYSPAAKGLGGADCSRRTMCCSSALWEFAVSELPRNEGRWEAPRNGELMGKPVTDKRSLSGWIDVTFLKKWQNETQSFPKHHIMKQKEDERRTKQPRSQTHTSQIDRDHFSHKSDQNRIGYIPLLMFELQLKMFMFQ